MIKTHIRKDMFGRDYSLYFHRPTSDNHYACISKIEWTQHAQDGSEPVSEPLMLKPEEAQYLMNALWDVGFRPSEGTGSAGAMAATQKHLEDMRKLVFKL